MDAERLIKVLIGYEPIVEVAQEGRTDLPFRPIAHLGALLEKLEGEGIDLGDDLVEDVRKLYEDMLDALGLRDEFAD